MTKQKKIPKSFSSFSWLAGQFRWLILVFLFLNTACGNQEDKGQLIAQVGEYQLYNTDIYFLNYSTADSASVVSNYVNKWAAEKILVNEAESSEKIDPKFIDRKVEEFRTDLLIHQLEVKLVDEQLDTNISTKEIEHYYEKHKADFQLNDYLVKVLYLKIPLDAPEIEKINGAYKLRNDDDLITIEEYAKLYASNFYYDIDNWIYFDDILKEIPLHDINKDRFILKRSKIRFEETGFYYFLNIIDYKLKNSTSPIGFERNNIKARILNLRVKTLRETIKNDIIKKAYEESKVNLY